MPVSAFLLLLRSELAKRVREAPLSNFERLSLLGIEVAQRRSVDMHFGRRCSITGLGPGRHVLTAAGRELHFTPGEFDLKPGERRTVRVRWSDPARGEGK